MSTRSPVIHVAGFEVDIVRKSIKNRFFPTLRLEYYNDPDGFTTGVAQNLWGITFTGDYRLGNKGEFANLMLRPEIRWDTSSTPFFSDGSGFRTRKSQITLGLGLVASF